MAEKNNPIKYENGKIYKIVCNITGDIYVGSTTKQYLSQRLTKHKSNYRDYLNGRSNRYITSFKILENNNYDIILLENVNSNNKDELRSRERYYIETLKCVNKVVPKRTMQEYKHDHKEQIKEYYQKNKERILAIQKENYSIKKEYYFDKIQCSCGGRYSLHHKARHEKTKKHLDYMSKST